MAGGDPGQISRYVRLLEMKSGEMGGEFRIDVGLAVNFVAGELCLTAEEDTTWPENASISTRTRAFARSFSMTRRDIFGKGVFLPHRLYSRGYQESSTVPEKPIADIGRRCALCSSRVIQKASLVTAG